MKPWKIAFLVWLALHALALIVIGYIWALTDSHSRVLGNLATLEVGLLLFSGCFTPALAE